MGADQSVEMTEDERTDFEILSGKYDPNAWQKFVSTNHYQSQTSAGAAGLR